MSAVGVRGGFVGVDPHPAFVRLCRARGVPITLGSDAHALEEVGAGLPEARDLVWAAGYRHVGRLSGAGAPIARSGRRPRPALPHSLSERHGRCTGPPNLQVTGATTPLPPEFAAMRLAFLLRPAPNDATAAQVSEVSAEVIQRVRGAGPVVLGPHGGEGRESAIRSADDLPAASDEPQVLVARRPPPAARRSRLVVVGDDVFGAAEAGRAQPVLSDLARRCGPTLGLELYAVEAAETDAGPVVLPLDPIPDFAGVPAAGRRLAEYVARAGRR